MLESIFIRTFAVEIHNNGIYMKKTLLIIFAMLALVACNKKDEAQQPGEQQTGGNSGKEEPTGFHVSLTYDSEANMVTAMPSDTMVEYVLFVWMKEDFILDYGDDFSDEHVKESLQAYIDMCIEWNMAFPTFRGETSMDVYEWFDQPYPGEEFIAMAASFNKQTRKIEGGVDHIFFTTPEE